MSSIATAALDPATLNALRARVKGPVLERDAPGFEDSRTVWNGMIDRRPAVVLRPLGTADVIEGIRVAREHDLPLCIKGGGHNISGLAVCDGGVLLDMSAMRGVWVDRAAKTARAQAGCLLADVDRETQLHGLAAVMGFVSATGAAGLTLGGGFGYLTRRFGWTCDNVRAFEMVTADGRIVRASDTENADLFWGLRGGGGNFGAVTGIEYALHPVGPEIVGGIIAWPAEDTAQVLELYRDLATNSPPEMACVLVLRIAPPAPWLKPEIHGKPIVGILACHTGSVVEGEKAVARIKSFGKPVGDVIQRRPYVTQQNLLDATQPKGRRYYWKSEYTPGADPALLEMLAAHAQKLPTPHSAILAFPIGGPLNDLPADHSAVGNRDAKLVVNFAGACDSPDQDDACIDWARAAWRDLRPFSTGTYVNFLTQEEGDDRVRAAYGENYDRLARVKAKWDPDNVFRMNKNIEPVGA